MIINDLKELSKQAKQTYLLLIILLSTNYLPISFEHYFCFCFQRSQTRGHVLFNDSSFLGSELVYIFFQFIHQVIFILFFVESLVKLALLTIVDFVLLIYFDCTLMLKKLSLI